MPLHGAAVGLAVVMAYYVGSQLGFGLRLPSSGISFLWPPTAILSAILLSIPSRTWPIAISGAFAAHALAHALDGLPASTWIMQFVANGVQAVLGAAIVRAYYKAPMHFTDLRSVAVFVLGVVVVAPAVASVIAAPVYVSMGWAPTLGAAWRTRDLSNVLAALTFTPPVIAGIERGRAFLGASPRAHSTVGWRVPVLSVVLLVLGLVAAEFALDPARRAGSLTPEETLTIVQVIIAAAAVPLMLLAAVIEERQAEHAKLRESQQRYALATAASGVGVWEWRAGGQMYVDPRLAQSLGYPPRTDTSIDEWLHRVLDEDRDGTERAVRSFVASGEPFFEFEARVLNAAGHRRWLQVRGAATRTSDARLDHVIGTYSDSTDRRNDADALEDSQARLRELAGRLMSVQENERARIARNLHDNASQELAALAIRLGVLERDARSSGHQDQPELQSLRDQAVDISEQIRQFAHELHPSILQRAGLPAAIAAICRRAASDYQLRVDPTFLIGVEAAPNVALCLYRVCQEALLNVAKHAAATRVWVTVTSTADAAQLEVRDNGRGFERSRISAGGIGLLSLDERLRLLQGTLVVDTQPGRGTTIRATVPAART